MESYPDDVKEGALEFIKYRTAQNKAEKERMLSENPEDLTFAERDYLAVYQGNPQFVPNYQVKWNSILQEETLGAALPDLAMGKIDAAEFTRRADESIQQFLEEQ